MQHVPSSYIHARFPLLLVSFVSFCLAFRFSLGFLFIPSVSNFGLVVDVFRGGFHSLFYVPSFLPFSIISILSPATTSQSHITNIIIGNSLHIITHTRHLLYVFFFYEQHCNGYKSLYRSCIGGLYSRNYHNPGYRFSGCALIAPKCSKESTAYAFSGEKAKGRYPSRSALGSRPRSSDGLRISRSAWIRARVGELEYQSRVPH